MTTPDIHVLPDDTHQVLVVVDKHLEPLDQLVHDDLRPAPDFLVEMLAAAEDRDGRDWEFSADNCVVEITGTRVTVSNPGSRQSTELDRAVFADVLRRVADVLDINHRHGDNAAATDTSPHGPATP